MNIKEFEEEIQKTRLSAAEKLKIELLLEILKQIRRCPKKNKKKHWWNRL